MSSGLLRLCVTTVAISSALSVAACGASSSTGKPSSVVQVDNGEAAKSGPQVMKDAVAAMTAAGSVHITAVGTEGKPAQKLSMDGYVNSDGLSISMTFGTGKQDLISIGKTTYVKASGTGGSGLFFPAALTKEYANRWLKIAGDPSDTSEGSSSGFTFFSTGDDDSGDSTLTGLAKSMAEPDTGVTINSKVTKADFNGEPVVLLTESDGSSFTVAASGEPYLLKAFKAATKDDEDEGSGTLTFSDYGKHVTFAAPANAVDLETVIKQDPSALFPSGLPTQLPSGFPTDFPTDVPSS
jgi:hypothetical protein